MNADRAAHNITHARSRDELTAVLDEIDTQLDEKIFSCSNDDWYKLELLIRAKERSFSLLH